VNTADDTTPAATDTAADTDEDGAQVLYAAVIADEDAADATLDVTTLATDLAREVPEYMVPSKILVVDTLPMNHNGKLDRKALAELF